MLLSAGMRRSALAIYTMVACLTVSAFATTASAQSFPTRPIKLIAEHLQQAWGQPVVVEPRPGGGGKLAASAVATAEPDGHTLLFATPTYTLASAMKLASHDLVKDFEPVSLIGLISYALVVHPGVE